MKISGQRALRLAAGATLLTGMAGIASAQVDLNSVGYVQYGDASSYSMPFAIIDQCNGKAPGCQYNITSTPGAIQDLVVIATGTSSNPTTTNFVGMDNAYATPTGVNGSTFFTTNPATNTNGGAQGTILNNDPNTWDSTLAALKTFLTVGGTVFQPVFFFNNNQTNSGGAATESLAAWMRVTITDSSGAIVAMADPNQTGMYDLTNHDGAYKLVTEGGGGVFSGDAGNYTSDGSAPTAGDNASTDYVLSGGMICRQGGVPVSCSLPHDEEVAHNLGADHVAYAILFDELSAQLASMFGTYTDAELAGFTLHVDLRLGCDPLTAAGNCTGNGTTVPFGRDLNNGYEQLFLGRATPVDCPATDPACAPPPTIPEPGTLALAGLGLAALTALGRRKNRKQAIN